MFKILIEISEASSFLLDTEETTDGKVLYIQVGDRVFEFWVTKKGAS